MDMRSAGHGMFTRHEISPQEARMAAKRVRDQQEADAKAQADLMKLIQEIENS